MGERDCKTQEDIIERDCRTQETIARHRNERDTKNAGHSKWRKKYVLQDTRNQERKRKTLITEKK